MCGFPVSVRSPPSLSVDFQLHPSFWTCFFPWHCRHGFVVYLSSESIVLSNSVLFQVSPAYSFGFLVHVYRQWVSGCLWSDVVLGSVPLPSAPQRICCFPPACLWLCALPPPHFQVLSLVLSCGGSVCWLTVLICFQASLRLLFLASHLWHTGLYSCCLRVFLHSFCSCFYSPVLPSSSQSHLSVFSRVTVPVLFHSYSGLLHTLYMFGSLWMPCSCELGSYCLHVTGSQYERT